MHADAVPAVIHLLGIEQGQARLNHLCSLHGPHVAAGAGRRHGRRERRAAPPGAPAPRRAAAPGTGPCGRILGFLLLPGDIAEQPEPVEDRGRRPARPVGARRRRAPRGAGRHPPGGRFRRTRRRDWRGLAAGWRNQAGQPLARFRRWRRRRPNTRTLHGGGSDRARSVAHRLGPRAAGASLVRRNTKDSGTPIGCMPCWLSRLASAGPMNIAPSDRNRRLSTSTTSLWVGRSK